jgi:Uma2 family endonuclease
VLSTSTEDYDKYGKFHEYKQLPSFKEYLLVEQRTPLVTTRFKTAEGTWQDSEADGSKPSIYLKSTDCTIELQNIYEDVDFPSY